MTPILHPSEIRLPAPAKRALRPILLGLGGACVAASFAAGAFVLARLPEEPVPNVTFTRIEDWPEIKDGVPALAPRKAVQADQAASAAPPLKTVPPAPVKAEPAPPAEPILAARPPEPEAVAGLELRGAPATEPDDRSADRLASPTSEPPATSASAPPVPIEPAQAPGRTAEAAKAAMEGSVAAVAAIPATPVATPQAPPDAAPSSAAPAAAKAGKARARPRTPQTRAAEARPKPPAKSAKAKPRAEKVASAPRAPVEASPAAPPPAAPAAEDDDRVHVLGLSLPNLLPSGRKIREAIGSLGL
jgi:hypothetical protein